MLTPLRSRTFGDSLGWMVIAMFDSASHDIEELRDAYCAHYGAGCA